MTSFDVAELRLKRRHFSDVVPDRPVEVATISPARRDAFADAGPAPWLDRPDARDRIDERVRKGEISEALAEMFRFWVDNGYVVLSKFFSDSRLDAAWSAYEAAIKTGKLTPKGEYGSEDEAGERFPGRVLNPHFQVKKIKDLLADDAMVRIMSELLGVKALPFQTIGGHRASQQLPHSDTIHMTTYPLGYLTANWIAFEDIADDSGPLEYYPGSHKLAYQLSHEAGIGLEEARKGYLAYHQNYEPLVQRTIEANGLKPSFFQAKKGDVLIWHANLLHGGSRRRNPDLSRKALVCHYFAQGCVCYHDYAGNLSHLHEDEMRRVRLRQPDPQADLVTRQTFDAEAYLSANEDVRQAGVDPWKHWTRHGKAERRPLRPPA